MEYTLNQLHAEKTDDHDHPAAAMSDAEEVGTAGLVAAASPNGDGADGEARQTWGNRTVRLPPLPLPLPPPPALTPPPPPPPLP